MTIWDRRQVLLRKVLELDHARELALALGKLVKGGTTLEETNAKLAEILAERRPVDAELAEVEAKIAELAARQPIVLRGSDLDDAIALFEYAFSTRSPPPGIIAALDRLRKLKATPSVSDEELYRR
jgi:hypothetical protein